MKPISVYDGVLATLLGSLLVCAQNVLGRLYRAAVIGSGGHRLATRRLLRKVARAT